VTLRISLLFSVLFLFACTVKIPVVVPRFEWSGCEAKEGYDCASPVFPISPGHHDLTLKLKTKKLELGPDRHLDQALSIRLRLFNEKHEEIALETQFLGQQIDAGQLNYALNRVDSDQLIDPLGFTAVHLVPRYYPFDAGWFPEETAEAQLVISLSGAGTASIRDINISYSKWNFPLQDRVANVKLPLISPEPQEFKQTGAVFPVGEIKIHSLEDHPAINEELNKLKIIHSAEEYQLKLTLKKGITKPEGYKLATTSSGTSIIGSDIRGLLYGLQTFRQLLRVDAQGLASIPEVTIIDYPAYKLRAASGRDVRNMQFAQEISAASWLPESRFNALFIEAVAGSEGWEKEPEYVFEAAEKIGAKAKSDQLLDLGVIINPYLIRKGSEAIPFSFASIKDKNSFKSIVGEFLLHNATQIMFSFDDYPPKIPGQKFGFTLSALDALKFPSLADAHLSLVSETTAKIKENFPKTKLYFVPTWYNPLFSDLSNGLGVEYLWRIGASLPLSIPILWTGPTVRSLFVDDIQMKRFQRMIHGRAPVLWDNTLYARRDNSYWGGNPDRKKLISVLEPFDVEMGSPGDLFYSNSHFTELYRIQLATLGAFLWNPKKYNPEAALLSYLTQRFGGQTAAELLEFDRLASSGDKSGALRQYDLLAVNLAEKDNQLLLELKELIS
jgi:hypothetical protein